MVRIRHRWSMTTWSHESVRALVDEGDPIDVITNRARDLVFRAAEQGWSGPPFDPLALAALLGVRVVPHEDVFDARLVGTPRGPRIEYNPNRPPGRRRYSVAHELGHLLFEDHADAVRNRQASHAGDGDEWQLELLCNIAAAEIVMPIGTFNELGGIPLTMTELLPLQAELQVSTEALLMRVTRLAETPAAAFAASRIEPTDENSPFRLDYVAPNTAWRPRSKPGGIVEPPTLMTACTAVGQTSEGEERWPRMAELLHVEAVGVPPFPGHRFPRVVGLLTPHDDAGLAGPRIHYIANDATRPRGDGPKVIAHIVNDVAASWHGGFSNSLRRQYPAAADDFTAWTSTRRSEQELGAVHFFDASDEITIASMVAQQGFGRSKHPRIRYAALREALGVVALHALDRGASVHMPLIGTGQAGGSWPVVEELVAEALVEAGVDVTVYETKAGAHRHESQTQLSLHD